MRAGLWPRLAAFAALAGGSAVRAQDIDPANPTCPRNPDWSANGTMSFRVMQRPGARPVLLAEGAIDTEMIPRLQVALDDFRGDEIWLRSPGGDARTANQAASLIRRSGAMTRIPAGWACNGACAFMFMGGIARTVEPGGLFVIQRTATPGGRSLGEVAQTAAQQASEDQDMLLRMGISRTLLSEVLYRLADGKRRCLSPAELARYTITNR